MLCLDQYVKVTVVALEARGLGLGKEDQTKKMKNSCNVVVEFRLGVGLF